MKLLIDPHGDDGALFAAFTIMRERPSILVIFDSYIQTARGAQGCDVKQRRMEALDAWVQMDARSINWLAFRDDEQAPQNQIAASIASEFMNQTESVTDIWAPAYEEGGHEQHNLVALACDVFEGTCNVHRYLTYTRAGGKSTAFSVGRDKAQEILPQSGEDIARKHRALACFKSQMQLDPRIGCSDWFLGDLREYALLPAKSGEGRVSKTGGPQAEFDELCLSCVEDPDPDDPIDYDNYKCPKSKRPCGHHCNHSWSHEQCCWCGVEFGEIEESPALELGREIGH